MYQFARLKFIALARQAASGRRVDKEEFIFK
jgi:hypothetical protein